MSIEGKRKTLGVTAFLLSTSVFIIATLILPQAALADDLQDAQQLAEKARLTFESFVTDPTLGSSIQSLVSKARGVLIYPQVLRGAFVIGASGGSGALVVRNMATGQWSGPAFYTIGQASFGLQAGIDASEVVLVALTERGVSAFLSTSAKLGGDASVALGPIGVGVEGATQNLSVDIVSYSRNKGLYAGISVNGAVVGVREALNTAYYGKTVSPVQILIQREVSNPSGAPLIEAIAKAAGGS